MSWPAKLSLHSERQGVFMQNIGLGDVFFILFILGVIHGIMYLVGRVRDRAKPSGEKIKEE